MNPIMRFSFALILFAASLTAGCSNSAPTPVANSNTANTNRPLRSEQMQNSVAHTTENQPPKPANSNSTSKMGSGGEPIDTAKYDGVIAEAEKAYKAKPNDPAAKSNLADAYFDRGFALTDSAARQYAAALGDYRRALKIDPNHEEARKWHDQIVSIFRSLGKEPPKEGEEPAPLPFQK